MSDPDRPVESRPVEALIAELGGTTEAQVATVPAKRRTHLDSIINMSMTLGRLAKLAGHPNPDGITIEEAADVIRRKLEAAALLASRATPVESVVGRFCREHRHEILGCSGEGRPSCGATECIYGAEPCPIDPHHFKPEGAACNVIHKTAVPAEGRTKMPIKLCSHDFYDDSCPHCAQRRHHDLQRDLRNR